MKLLSVPLWAWPLFATGQALTPAPPRPVSTAAARDSSTGWELQLQYDRRTSYLAREYGRHAYSVSTQVSYAAANGFYGTLEGLYFSPVRPAYVYTDLELGYAGQINDRWSYALSGSRTFYAGRISKRDSVLRNCVAVSTQVDAGPVSVDVTYDFLFDRFHAQLVGLVAGLPLRKTKWLVFDEASLTPAVEMDWGSSLALLRFGSFALPNNASFGGLARPTQRLVPLAYELSLPLKVQRGPVALNLTGRWLMPLRVRGETRRPAAFAYFSAGLIFRFP